MDDKVLLIVLLVIGALLLALGGYYLYKRTRKMHGGCEQCGCGCPTCKCYEGKGCDCCEGCKKACNK
jgi:LPXTG-motif cell wall-anchored protein